MCTACDNWVEAYLKIQNDFSLRVIGKVQSESRTKLKHEIYDLALFLYSLQSTVII